jgi:hypothetical protein
MTMISLAEKRSRLIRLLEEAWALADELKDVQTGFLIERALDEATLMSIKPATG